MATIHLHQTTNATPGPFLAGLTDFGPGRSKSFPNSAGLKGRLLASLLSTGDKRVLASAPDKTVEALEARNYQLGQAQS